MKSVLISIFLLCFLIGCDNITYYEKEINNLTNDTISIFFKGKTRTTNEADSIIVLPMKKNLYFNNQGSWVGTNFDCEPQIIADEVTIKISGGKKLLKDLSKKENWSCVGDKDNNSNWKNSYWKMTFTITSDDLK